MDKKVITWQDLIKVKKHFDDVGISNARALNIDYGSALFNLIDNAFSVNGIAAKCQMISFGNASLEVEIYSFNYPRQSLLNTMARLVKEQAGHIVKSFDGLSIKFVFAPPPPDIRVKYGRQYNVAVPYPDVEFYYPN